MIAIVLVRNTLSFAMGYGIQRKWTSPEACSRKDCPDKFELAWIVGMVRIRASVRNTSSNLQACCGYREFKTVRCLMLLVS
jgi:hypothetical protein